MCKRLHATWATKRVKRSRGKGCSCSQRQKVGQQVKKLKKLV